MRIETHRNRDLLLKALTELRRSGPANSAYGICFNWKRYSPASVRALQGRIDGYLCDLMMTWPEFSGIPAFPIKGYGCDPEAAYMDIEDLWDRTTEYGRARWRLLDWLIEQLEQQA